VKVGASEAQVREAFGEPTSVKDSTLVNGIKVHDLIWTSPNVRLQFDPASGKLLSYTVTSSDLKTADGFHVGTPVAEIKAKYGNKLGDALGVLLLSEGKKGTFPGILFGEKNGTVFRIDGGNVLLND
jgi:hypothetical protein